MHRTDRFVFGALLLLAVSGVASAQCAGDPDCIFSTGFDQMDDWEGCSGGNCGAGHACFVGADGNSAGNCGDHPLQPGNCEGCDPQPVTYSPYLSAPVVGGNNGRACRIQSQSAAGRPARGGGGKMLVNYMGSSGASFNDCVFMKIFDDRNGDNKPDQYPEIWTSFSYRVDQRMETAMGGAQSSGGDDMKFGRIGHHKGNFTNSTNQWFGFNNSPHQDAFGLWNIRRAGGEIKWVSAPRCQTQYRPCSSQSQYGGSFSQVQDPVSPLFDGEWHTITTKHKVNSDTSPPWDGEFFVFIDGSTVASDGDNGMNRVSFFDSGWSGPIPGWNWAEIGGNSRITHSEGIVSMEYDDWCIATTRAGAEACHARLLGQSVTPACDDGFDNDGDGLTDLNDPGCSDAADTSERSAALACDDGVDNDGDGDVDLNDAGCSAPADTDETNCGDGVASGSELCDAGDLNGGNCSANGGFGQPTCTPSCTLDFSTCSDTPPPTSCMTFDEVDDYVRISDSAELTLPADDWTVGIYSRPTDNDGTAYQYAVSNNSTAADNSLNILLQEQGTGNRWLGIVRDGASRERQLTGSAVGADGQFRLIVLRRSDDLDLIYCTASGCSVEDSEALSGFESVQGADWNLGRRSDGDADRYFGGELCYFFMTDRALSDGELTNYARFMSPVADETLVLLGADMQTDLSTLGQSHPGQLFGGPQPVDVGPPFVQPVCGNGDWEAGEVCDGSDVGDSTCPGSGALGCQAGCAAFDTSACGSGGEVPENVDGLERTDDLDG